MSARGRHIKPKHFRKLDGCPACRHEYLVARNAKRERDSKRLLRLELTDVAPTIGDSGDDDDTHT